MMEGFPIAMSPTPVPEHQHIAAEITAELILAFRKSKCGECRVYHPLDYVLAEDTTVVPDVLIVGGETTKKHLDFSPVHVVEILSPSTALRGRNTKFELYQQQGLWYYLLVDRAAKEMEVFCLENGLYKKKKERTDTISS